jgi:hypothetical protein
MEICKTFCRSFGARGDIWLALLSRLLFVDFRVVRREGWVTREFFYHLFSVEKGINVV